MDDLLGEFLGECLESTALLDGELARLKRDPGDLRLIASALRRFHAIKGSCGFLGLSRLEALAHAVEGVLDRLRDGGLPPTAAVVGALLVALDRMKAILAGTGIARREPPGDDGALLAALDTLAKGGPAPPMQEPPCALGRWTTARRADPIAGPSQPNMAQVRSRPIDAAWRGLPAIASSLARALGKAIEIEQHGGGIALDGQVVELIRDSLIQMVRNAADHGIETKDERRRKGKPETGRITLNAFREDGYAVIEIADDGRGLDTRRIAEQAVAHGLVEEIGLAAMAEADIHRLILHPGISTARTVTPLSGRGVGLDVVSANIEKLGGSLAIRSASDLGTAFRLKIPIGEECGGNDFPKRPLGTLRRRLSGAAPQSTGGVWGG